MARDIDDIQRDIERTRAQLAGTLDELAHRTKPATLVEDAKTGVSTRLQDPTVQKVIAGVAAAVVGVVVLSVVRNRRKANDIKEIQKLLAQRSWA